ncbi:MAG: TonB-dependent receptor [Candidatus Kapabacteria bacterium]|nr:TonB-dependent receptor [Candidatus Kapabacteria bacterium]
MRTLCTLFIVISVISTTALSQGVGVIKGRVSDAISKEDLSGLNVLLAGRTKMLTTKNDGSFIIGNVPPGKHVVKIWGLGWLPQERTVDVTDNDTANITVVLDPTNRNMGEIMVYAASRQGEKLTDAPAAVDIVTPMAIEQATAHGQTAKSMENFAGIDVAQSGSNDFNVNARGFNNSINRRMLVLIDGRDPSTPLINLVEWNSLQTVLDDISSIEVVHGPGSALYGPNAYNGVVNIRSSAPREVLGTRVSLSAGEWETYRASLRHAGAVGDLSYKLSLGASTSYNYSLQPRNQDATKPNNGLEYPGLAFDVTDTTRGYSRVLSDAHRHPFSVVGTLRFDYDLTPLSKLVAEGGYSASGNEMYVNQTGRLIVQRVEKPYARLAYQSERINVQGLWQRRNTPDKQVVYNALAASLESSDIYGVDAQYNNLIPEANLRYIVGVQAEYQDVNSPLYNDTIGTYTKTGLPIVEGVGLTSETHMIGRFVGGYVQGEWKPTDIFTVVGAVRVDGSNLFETQLSPKLGVVIEPVKNQAFRLTYNRSFLRPSYTDLYRKSPAGAPANLGNISRIVDSVTSALVGQTVAANLNLSSSTPQWNLGNQMLTPETAQSFEFGYKGSFDAKLFVGVNVYLNRRANLISAPLGGVTPDVYAPVRSNTGNTAFNVVADSVLFAEVRKVRAGGVPVDPNRLANYNGASALVIAPANIAIVNELGTEVSASYFITNELSINTNYAYIDVSVQDNDVPTAKILPNTSRHRINAGVHYLKAGQFDAGLDLRYVEGFKWIAGLFEGNVPSYAVLNLNAGYYITPELRASVNVFNLLDRQHYEIFGGTILRRQVMGTVTYTF